MAPPNEKNILFLLQVKLWIIVILDQDFEAKNFMGHFKPNFCGTHDGTHKKRPTACVLMKNEVN